MLLERNETKNRMQPNFLHIKIYQLPENEKEALN